MSLADNNGGFFDLIWEQVISALVSGIVDFILGLFTGILPVA